MNKEEFAKALAIAKSKENLETADICKFDGFGLSDFEPVGATLREVARLMRWQAQMFNGEWDGEALGEIREYGRKNFIIVDGLDIKLDGYVPEEKSFNRYVEWMHANPQGGTYEDFKEWVNKLS